MQFIINQPALLKELGFLQGVIEKRNTIPILGHLLIEAESGRLRLQATDLDLSLVTTCPAEVAAAGTICLPARKLFDIVKALPSAEIRFKSDAHGATAITCERARFKLHGIECEQFPELPSAPASVTSLAATQLRQFISRTLFATCDEESRYNLNGVKLEITRERLRMVGTDGHRLSMVEVQGSFGESLAVDAIIPRKALSELARIAAETEGEISFAEDSNHLFFQAGERCLTARRLAGSFPNYELVIPKDNPHHLELETAVAAAALRRVALMADDRSRAVKIETAQGQLTLSSQGKDAGEAGETLVAAYTGEAITAACNATYLQDFLSVAGSESVRIEIKDANSQFCLRPLGLEGFNFTYVLMPMRI